MLHSWREGGGSLAQRQMSGLNKAVGYEKSRDGGPRHTMTPAGSVT